MRTGKSRCAADSTSTFPRRAATTPRRRAAFAKPTMRRLEPLSTTRLPTRAWPGAKLTKPLPPATSTPPRVRAITVPVDECCVDASALGATTSAPTVAQIKRNRFMLTHPFFGRGRAADCLRLEREDRKNLRVDFGRGRVQVTPQWTRADRTG